MHGVSIKTLLLVVGLTASGIACAGRGMPAPPPPMIVKTAVDPQGKTLIITGRHFGATTPTVVLADQLLDVKRFSQHEVVASLPRGLTAATYGVTVITTGRNRASSNLFSATLASGRETMH